MILCFTTDDSRIVDDAYAGYDPHVFGTPYCYLPRHGYRGLLGQAENLFISAHGNDHEIGNERGRPAYTPPSNCGMCWSTTCCRACTPAASMCRLAVQRRFM